jgi:hypothetical protein
MDTLTDERRLVSRVVGHWRDRALEKRFPSRDQIDRWLVGDDWVSCTLIELASQDDQSTFVVVGPNLLPPGHEPVEGKPISACPRNTLLAALVRYLPRFQPNGGPLSISGTAIHGAGPILFRAALLPLSSDGGARIDSVLGAANFRELQEGEDRELRTRLQVAILNVEKGQLWEVYNPTFWGGWGKAVVTVIEKDVAKLRHKSSAQTITCKVADMLQHAEKYRFVGYS